MSSYDTDPLRKLSDEQGSHRKPGDGRKSGEMSAAATAEEAREISGDGTYRMMLDVRALLLREHARSVRQAINLQEGRVSAYDGAYPDVSGGGVPYDDGED